MILLLDSGQNNVFIKISCRESRRHIITHIFFRAQGSPLARERNTCKNNLLNAGEGWGEGKTNDKTLLQPTNKASPLPNPLPRSILCFYKRFLRGRGDPPCAIQKDVGNDMSTTCPPMRLIVGTSLTRLCSHR